MQNIPISEQKKYLPQSSFGKLVVVILLTIFYFYAGKLGLSLAFVNPSATAVWPPAGIALAAFLIFGDYLWPAVLLGAFLVNITTSEAVWPALAIAMGNTIEGLVGAYLVNRYANGAKVFARAQDVLKFAILAGLFATGISATLGTISLIWGGLALQSDFMTIWSTWWLGDATGILVVAPLLILWSTSPKPTWTPAQVAESGFMLLSAVLVALTVFGNNEAFTGAENYPLEFLIVPWIIWAAFRFGQRGTASLTGVISAVAVEGALRGVGPFAQALPNESLLLLQGFMGTVAITGLVLAALVSERQEIETALRESNARLRQGVDELQRHNNKMILLNDMGDLLQSCSSIEEAYTIIAQFGERLFRKDAGALYMINDSQSTVEAAVVWGTYPPEPDTFALDQCWALRRGRMHLMNESGLELPCPHLQARPPLAALCIPMIAQGETMGIFHLQSGLAPLGERNGVHKHGAISEIQLQLAKTMADTIALALANLKLRMSLLHQSIRDPLTDLFNRRYLEETLEREVRRATRLEGSVAVIMLDIDHFKKYNDAFGHAAGDALLRELGNFLKQETRGGDFACRYGGEEFVLILPEISQEDALNSAERMRENVKELNVQYSGGVLENITLSLGVALFPIHGTIGKTVLHAADEALYEAKHQGRDRVVVAMGTAEEPSASQ